LPVTPLGLEAWNAARRPSKSVLKRVFEGRSYSRRSNSGISLPGSSESSDAEFEDDSATITPATATSSSGGLSSLMSMSGRRSRSNTTSNQIATVVVNPNGERGEQTRRLAGAGASDGLGRGLLSYVVCLSPPFSCSRDLTLICPLKRCRVAKELHLITMEI